MSMEKESKRLRELIKKLDLQIRKLKREHVKPAESAFGNASAKGLRPPVPVLPKPSLGPASNSSTEKRNTYLRSWRLANVGAGKYFGARIASKMSKVISEFPEILHS